MTTTATHLHPPTAPAHDEHRQIGRPRIPLWAALASGVVISVALGFALRALGRETADGPAALTPRQTAALLPATLLPGLGCGFGFYMAFHAKPRPYSMRLFVGIGALMGLAGVAISATKLPASAGGGSIITTIAVAPAPTLLIIPALLTLVPRSKAQRSSPWRWQGSPRAIGPLLCATSLFPALPPSRSPANTPATPAYPATTISTNPSPVM